MLQFQIKETECYGLITNNCISLDDKNTFNNSLILVELYKIKCFLTKDKKIIGIITLFRDRIKKEKNSEYQSILIKLDNNSLEQEFIFKEKESIINITIWKEEALNGFEIVTNQNRKFLFGLNSGNKIMLNEFASNSNKILGFYSKFDLTMGLIALGFYYVSFKEQLIFLYSGFFYLRAKLKNKDFNKHLEANISKIDYTNKAILNLCLLPKNLFVNIMKYLIN